MCYLHNAELSRWHELAATGRWRMQAMTFGSSDLLARSEAERRRVAGSRRLSSALAAALRGRQQVIVKIWISAKVGRSPESYRGSLTSGTGNFSRSKSPFRQPMHLSCLGLLSASRLRQQLLLLSPNIIATSMLYRRPGNGSGIVKAN